MPQIIQVRLTTDLTRYHQRLVPGVEGVTVGEFGMWSRGSDRFVGVHFPDIGTFDILWDSLEIIDEQFLREAEAREHEKWEQLKHARNVVLCRGPRGGFRYLSYEYETKDGITTHASTSFRSEADKLLEFFKGHGITIRELQQR